MAEIKSTDKMGCVFFSSPIEARPHGDVLAALEHAGMDQKLGRELKPRSAFIRGMKALQKEGIIQADFRDKTEDSDERIRFAFVHRLPGENYAADVAVEFDKGNNQVYVVKAPEELDRDAIVSQARKFIESAKGEFSVADIGALIKKYFAALDSRRVMLRAGVYFLPKQFEPAARQLSAFYDALQFSYFILPIGYDQNDVKGVQRAITGDLKREIKALSSEIERLQASGGLTNRIAKARVAELKKAVRQYRNLAKTARMEWSKLLKDAGNAGTVIMQASMTDDEVTEAIRQGRRFDPLAKDLLQAAVPDDDLDGMRRVSRLESVNATAIDLDPDPAWEGEADTLFPTARRKLPAMLEHES